MKIKVLFKFYILLFIFSMISCTTVPTSVLKNGLYAYVYDSTTYYNVRVEIVLKNLSNVSKNVKVVCRVYKDGEYSIKDTKSWIIKVFAKSKKVLRLKTLKSFVGFSYNCGFLPLQDKEYALYKKYNF